MSVQKNARLRAIYRAADRTAAGYLVHQAREDSLFATGAINPGDEISGYEQKPDGGSYPIISTQDGATYVLYQAPTASG